MAQSLQLLQLYQVQLMVELNRSRACRTASKAQCQEAEGLGAEQARLTTLLK